MELEAIDGEKTGETDHREEGRARRGRRLGDDVGAVELVGRFQLVVAVVAVVVAVAHPAQQNASLVGALNKPTAKVTIIKELFV